MILKEHGIHLRVNPIAGRHTLLLFFLLLVILLTCCAPVSAAMTEIAPGTSTFGISNHTAIIWRSAQIDGDRIVWAESISNAGFVYNIYLYNITTRTETLVSPSSPDEPNNYYMGDEHPVAISGNRIVWTKHGNVWVYDIATGKRTVITAHTMDLQTDIDRFEPVISGDIVVWSEVRVITNAFHEPDIVACNLTTGKTIVFSHGAWDKRGVRISGSRIIWEDYRKGQIDRDIYLYDLATGQEHVICNASGTQFDPKISGDRIVWSDRRDQNWDVYLYDIVTGEETVIATGIKEQEAADISGDRIIWMEWPSMLFYNPYDESSRLMMYDLSTGKEYQVLKDIPGMFGPAISGNRIIFMDLAHIPAGQRDNPRENTVQEISLFTLDPGIFPLPIATPITQVNATGTTLRSPDILPPVTKPTKSPGFDTLCALPVLVIGILFTQIRRGQPNLCHRP